MSIITFEDIALSFGNINLMLISISGFGMLWIYLWHFIIEDKKFEKKLRKNTKNTVNEFRLGISEKIKHILKIKNSTYIKMVNLLILIVMSSIISLIFFTDYKPTKSINLKVLLFFNFFLVPALYIIFWKKRNLIFGLYIFLMLSYGIYFIDNITYISDSNAEVNTTISFEYDSTCYNTSKDTSLIFNGYKYLILKTESENIYDVIPKESISKLRINNN